MEVFNELNKKFVLDRDCIFLSFFFHPLDLNHFLFSCVICPVSYVVKFSCGQNMLLFLNHHCSVVEYFILFLFSLSSARNNIVYASITSHIL